MLWAISSIAVQNTYIWDEFVIKKKLKVDEQNCIFIAVYLISQNWMLLKKFLNSKLAYQTSKMSNSFSSSHRATYTKWLWMRLLCWFLPSAAYIVAFDCPVIIFWHQNDRVWIIHNSKSCRCFFSPYDHYYCVPDTDLLAQLSAMLS